MSHRCKPQVTAHAFNSSDFRPDSRVPGEKRVQLVLGHRVAAVHQMQQFRLRPSQRRNNNEKTVDYLVSSTVAAYTFATEERVGLL